MKKMYKEVSSNWGSVQPPIFKGNNYKEFTYLSWLVGDGGGSIWRTQNVDNLSVTPLKDLKVKRRRDFGALGLIQRRVDYPINFSQTLQSEYEGVVKVRAILSLYKVLEKS